MIPAGTGSSSLLLAASFSVWRRGSPVPWDHWLPSSHLCLALSACREHAGGLTTNTTYPPARGEEFLTWMHAPSSFCHNQYLAVVAVGVMICQENLCWKWGACMADEVGRGRSGVSKRRKCYGEPNRLQQEASPRGTSDPAKHRLQFVLWREIKPLVRSALGNEPLCCPLLEPALVLQGCFCHPNTAGQEGQKKIKPIACFLVPQQLETQSDSLEAPNFSQGLTTPQKMQASPERQVWASKHHKSCF